MTDVPAPQLTVLIPTKPTHATDANGIRSPSTPPPFDHRQTSTAAQVFDRGSRLMLAGGGAGAIAKTLVAPFERVKILCQTGQTQGLLLTYKQVMQEEGFLGFWRGNYANVIRIIPSKGVLCMCSDAFRDMLRGPNDVVLPTWKSVASGALSGATAVVCTYPLDLVRGRVSGNLGKANRYTGILTTVRLTIKEEGFAALYRGVGPTLAGAFPYEGIKFGVYDFLKRHAPRDEKGKLSEVTKLTIGAAAGTAAGVVMFPNDTVRRRIQMQGQGGTPILYTSGFDCYRKLVAQHGPGILYRGLAANLLRVVPNAALQFWAYEALKTALGITTKA